MISPREKKTALVTGGATGIGAACVRRLAFAGYQVVIHCNRSEADARAIASDLPNDPVVIAADLSTTAGVDSVYEYLKDLQPLHTLVNNAGISIDAPLFTAQVSDFDKLVDTNMRSVWYLTKRLTRLMIRQKAGRVINISSVVGSTGNAGQSMYSMTKAAIDAFTKSLAQELAPHGILVNSIAPGFISTSMTESLPREAVERTLSRIPLGRMGSPDEIAEWVEFLAARATYATGGIFHVNGGMYAG